MEFMHVNKWNNTVVFIKYFEYVKSLKFVDEPNYELLKKLFREELIKMKAENEPL